MSEKQVAAAFLINCMGAAKDKPLESPVDVSLTVYLDGERELGCSYLSRGKYCLAGGFGYTTECIHLYPSKPRID